MASSRCPQCRVAKAARSSSDSTARTCSIRSGIAHPGAIRLHNFPTHLQNLTQANGERFDLGDHRHPARPRARRAPLQPLPPPVPQGAGHLVRRAHGQPDVGRGDPARLQQRPGEGRSACRAHGRAAAPGLRLQRHSLPRVHSDGVAPPQERPLPLEGLPSGDLHEAGHRLGREHVDDRRPRAPLSHARARDEGHRERVPSVARIS